MEDENFKQELEEFFRLFKRLVEKESLGDVPGVDQKQMEQIKSFMAQFENVKDELKIEMIHADPFTKMMISTMVKQLREQLGPEADVMGTPSVEDIVDKREEELKALTDESQRMVSLIETIDEQLKNPALSDEEIDALLDRRSRISSKLAEN
ncbi:MAG: hypothetical protein IKM95_01190 [Bacteroidales bacterium]|nr:hypothetical protein [Bacteroidales bacterium]